MATYMVTGPDGRRYKVSAPDGATQEQALQYAQQNYQSAKRGPTVKRVQYPDGSIHRIEVPESATNEQTIAFAQQDYQQRAQGGSGADQQGSTRLQQIEQALRAADAAGNTDDARRLAQAYAQERDGQAQPIRVEGTDGQQFEFPPNTSREVMQKALRQHYGDPSRYQAPTSGYTEDQLFTKLQKADAAGDTEAAKVIADEIRRLRGEGPNAASARGSFSNVRGDASTMPVYPRSNRQYAGPMLTPSATAQGAPAAPTLAQTNAGNRAYRASPQAGIDRQRFEESQTAAKRREFESLPAPLRALVGTGSRVAAAGRGIGQLYAQAADYVAPRETSQSDLITGPTTRYDEAMAREAQARTRDAYMQGDTAATVGAIAGDVGLLAAPGGAVGRLSGLRALAANAGLGAGYAGLQPVVQGESRAANTAVGGAFGAAGHGIAAGVSAAGRRAAQAIPQEVRQMARRANDLGIPVHAGQVSQSLPVKVAASAGKYLPFSGYAKAASNQQEGINRAVARTFGVDAPKLSDDVMHRARQDLSRQFEEIYNRNAVQIGEKGARRLAEIEREAARRLTKDEAQVLRNQLDDILENSDDGLLTGQKYQAVRTALRKAEGNDKLGMAVRELRQGLDDIAADAVGPQDSAALKALRSKWANFRTVEQALKQVSGAGGDVRLAALWPLIRKGSTKEMRELARMGQTLLKDPIADSGTAQRSLLYNVLMGGTSLANPALIPFIAKAAAGGATIGRAANSNALARMMTRESRGVPSSKIGALLQRGTPYAAPIAAERYNGGGR